MMRDKLESFPTLAFIKFAIADNTKPDSCAPPVYATAPSSGNGYPCPRDPVVLSTPHVLADPDDLVSGFRSDLRCLILPVESSLSAPEYCREQVRHVLWTG